MRRTIERFSLRELSDSARSASRTASDPFLSDASEDVASSHAKLLWAATFSGEIRSAFLYSAIASRTRPFARNALARFARASALFGSEQSLHLSDPFGEGRSPGCTEPQPDLAIVRGTPSN